MAKWGEGDPRWIVEERPDATNVNNWHWTEKNASDWSRMKFKELLIGLSVNFDEKLNGTCRITEVSRSDGDASANNRKAKLIFFFEWHLELKFEASVKGQDENLTGLIEIPNLSDENSADEVDVSFKMDSSGDAAYNLKGILMKKMTAKVKQALGLYITQLKEEYGKNLILPTKDCGAAVKGQQSQPEIASDRRKMPSVDSSKLQKTKSSEQRSVGLKIAVRNLSLTENFMCTANDLYNVFTMPEMVQGFTRAPCQVDARPGGRFVMFNGHIEGKFSLLLPGQQLNFDWRAKNWPVGHYSLVVMKFNQKDQSTELHLEQSQVPEDHYENTEDGWHRHYFNAIKQTFGFGAKLF